MQATIAELGHAPGKSMRASEDVQALHINERGLFGDREYMWVETEPHTQVLHKPGQINQPGRFLSQREDPVLTGIIPTLVDEGLTLRWQGQDELLFPRVVDTADTRKPVSVWGWSGEAVDQGDDAAAWGREYIGRPVRLVGLSDVKPRFVEGDPELGRVGFADSYPVSVGSIYSFQKINDHLVSRGRSPLPNDRARANIILDGISVDNPEAFPEDFIETITIAHNGLTVVLRRWKACGRCPIPDTNQLTGERKPYFRSGLGKLGRSGTHTNTERFGTDVGLFYTQNFLIELPKRMPRAALVPILRGAEVEVTYSDNTNWIAAGKVTN